MTLQKFILCSPSLYLIRLFSVATKHRLSDFTRWLPVYLLFLFFNEVVEFVMRHADIRFTYCEENKWLFTLHLLDLTESLLLISAAYSYMI